MIPKFINGYSPKQKGDFFIGYAGHHPYLDDNNFSVGSGRVSLVCEVLSHFIVEAVCVLVSRVDQWSVFGIRKWKCAVCVERGNNIDRVEFVLSAGDDMGQLRC